MVHDIQEPTTPLSKFDKLQLSGYLHQQQAGIKGEHEKTSFVVFRMKEDRMAEHSRIITELPLSASAIQIRSSDLNRIPLNSIVITLKRLCQERKLFEIVSSKGGQPLYRPTDVALSGKSNQKSQQQKDMFHSSDVKTAQPITKFWQNKYNEGTLCSTD